MAKYWRVISISVIILCIMFSGCVGKSADERLAYEKPERIVAGNVLLDGSNVGGMQESILLSRLEKYALKMDRMPVNALINARTWEVTGGKSGKKLNIEKTMTALFNAHGGSRVDYVFEIVEPMVKAEQLKANIMRIAFYTTPLLNRSDSRVNNIGIASDRINYKILQPGDEFSFNKTVGRRTAGKGYEEAPIIIRTPEGPKKKKATGGGVCQVSTTIFNAVEECGLEVTERHLHSKDIGYVPKGEDATVSYGTVDFRFRNNRSFPIMLRLFLLEKSLTVKILENTNKT